MTLNLDPQMGLTTKNTFMKYKRSIYITIQVMVNVKIFADKQMGKRYVHHIYRCGGIKISQEIPLLTKHITDSI